MAAGQIGRGRRPRTPSARGRTSRHAEAVAGQHERHRAAPRGLGVDRRVADQHHRSAGGVPAQRQQAGGIGLARQRPVAGRPPRRSGSRTLQRVEQPLGRPARLVGEHGERQQRIERAQRVPQARVEAGGVEQALVVQREEAIERAGSPGVEAGRAQGPLHQHRGALADHADHLVAGQRPPAEFDGQGAGRRRQVGRRIDQRAVQIEDHGAGRRSVHQLHSILRRGAPGRAA